MKKYQIRTGTNYGVYPGNTKAEALLALYRACGYNEEEIWIENDKLQFAEADDYSESIMQRGVDGWGIEEVEAGNEEGDSQKKDLTISAKDLKEIIERLTKAFDDVPGLLEHVVICNLTIDGNASDKIKDKPANKDISLPKEAA